MKRSLVILAAVAALAAAGIASLQLAGAARSSSRAEATPCGPHPVSVFGYVRSLTRTGDHFELGFDPALMLTGVTATRAKLEDIGYGDVPNDSYVVNESRRAYTYLVPETADVTVLAPSLAGTPITVAQLAELVEGKEPVKLFEGLETGFWTSYANDTVCSLDQQYHP